jgi:ubiquinone/menaquinone biosynthesis C-methylase UbiE
MSVTWIGYTTRYRTGGKRLAQAARTLARQTEGTVICQAVECKRDVVEAMAALPGPMDAFHLISHSGMYGPMFGTTDMPEQFSPHEWRQLKLPFSERGEAFFHACRTGRWFAPFFARTHGVPAHGHHWYTTVSRRPDRYRLVPSWMSEQGDAYIVGQPGRKSHGLVGSAGKHLGLLPPEPMLRFEPQTELTEPAYDVVAELYDRVFDDIRVRGPEWRWLRERIDESQAVLDIGCGTGALLRALNPAQGIGVDVSTGMLERARERAPRLDWRAITGPKLPLPDASVDVVTSLLSWRYLDWDPLLAEVVRVLRPGGRLLVVDMVASPASMRELPTVLAHTLRERRHRTRFPGYVEARRALVQHPGWGEMLRYNPIRAEHEYRWFFESRFPGASLETLDVARNTRVVAFDTGPISARWFPPQSYP